MATEAEGSGKNTSAHDKNNRKRKMGSTDMGLHLSDICH